MNKAVILHGMPSKKEYFNPDSPSQSNKHWIPWVQRQLILKGVLAQTPELPTPYAPIYEKWLEVFEQFKIDEKTILIGHSMGGGFLLRWLSENNCKVGKVILVAPFIDPDKDEVKSDFFKFKMKENLSNLTKGLYILYSTDDEQEILSSVDQILKLDDNIQVKKFTNKGHLTLNDMGTEEFPELMEII